jgi:hypothetical protein
MEQLFWCAWCDEPVEEAPTTVNELPFHWRCLKRRMQARREERKARPKKRTPRSKEHPTREVS